METVAAILFFAFGLAFGSFLNVCIYRIPLALLELPENGEPVSAWREMVESVAAWRRVNQPERSFCPRCGHGIRGYDNIPVVSWLLLRGRCRDCGASISFRYAAVELLTAVLFLACDERFGLTLAAVKFCVFVFLSIALIFTDAEHRLLPDAYTIPGFILGLLFSVLVPVRDVVGWLLDGSVSWRVISLLDALLGAMIGAAFILGSRWLYKLARGREGMGLGDVKLMAMVGAFLGLRLTLLVIFGASILGSVFAFLLLPFLWLKRMRRRMGKSHEPVRTAGRRAWQSAKLIRYYAIPFGVFLGSMALFAVFYGETILRWYWSRYS